MIDKVTDLAKDALGAVDDLTESGEERQEQLSRRHEVDMIQGTWLTKNIRPLTLAALMVYWLILLPLLNYFGIDTPVDQVKAVEYLSIAAFTFYFGSKGYEKSQVIRAKTERKDARARRRQERKNKKDA